jgi:hypothetical protein
LALSCDPSGIGIFWAGFPVVSFGAAHGSTRSTTGYFAGKPPACGSKEGLFDEFAKFVENESDRFPVPFEFLVFFGG